MTDTYANLASQYADACRKGDLGRRARLEHELDKLTADDNARLTAPDALLKAALWYGRQGIPVFPCQPRGKQPIIRTGFKAATTDATQIREWWTVTPAANIGSPTGITFDVVDVDGPEGVGVIYGGDVTLPEEIGHSLTSRTAGHHVFIKPTGAGNRAGIYPHVDYRGRGGYVLLPPSIGANGKRYVWTRPLDLAAA